MDAIVTFHAVDDSGSVLSFPPDRFRRLVDEILGSGARIVPVRELLGHSESRAPRVALTFDDGFRNLTTTALPHLARLKVPATVYVVSEFVGRSNLWPSQPPGVDGAELMSWAELRDWTCARLAVGSHSATHALLDGPGDEGSWAREVRGSKAQIEDELGVSADTFAYPYGIFGHAAERAVRATYTAALTTKMRFLRAREDAHRLPRIDSYYLRNSPGPLFGPASRAYLAVRGLLRRLGGQ